MAISKGQKQIKFSRYVGVASVKVVAINPSNKELEKIFGRPTKEGTPEKNYLRTRDIDGKEVKVSDISIYVKTIPEECNGIDLITSVRFSIENRVEYNKDGNKFKVIDKYGRCAWCTKEEFDAKTDMFTKNDGSKYKASIDKNSYRKARVGEENLVKFIKTYLSIPNLEVYKNGVWVPNPNHAPSECEIMLDTIKDIAQKCKIDEIRDAIEPVMEENTIKGIIGIRTSTKDNKMFQEMWNQEFIAYYSTNINWIIERVKDAKNFIWANKDGGLGILQEYVMQPTAISPSEEDEPENDDDDEVVDDPLDGGDYEDDDDDDM